MRIEDQFDARIATQKESYRYQCYEKTDTESSAKCQARELIAVFARSKSPAAVACELAHSFRENKRSVKSLTANNSVIMFNNLQVRTII